MINEIEEVIFHEIKISNELRLLLLIQIKSEDQLFVKDYLNYMLKKEWI